MKFEVSGPKLLAESEREAEIIEIDRFGNIITNLNRSDLPQTFYLTVHQTIIERHYKFYAEAEPSEIFTIWGSAGYLEIAAFQKSAAQLLNLAVGDKLTVKS